MGVVTSKCGLVDARQVECGYVTGTSKDDLGQTDRIEMKTKVTGDVDDAGG